MWPFAPVRDQSRNSLVGFPVDLEAGSEDVCVGSVYLMVDHCHSKILSSASALAVVPALTDLLEAHS